MRGLYLTGAEVKAGTQQTSILLKSAGPVTQGLGDLDELDVTTKELDVQGDSLIYASKLIECADGISLTVRGDARLILPPKRKFPLLAFMLITGLAFLFFGTLLVSCINYTSDIVNKVLCSMSLCINWLCIVQCIIRLWVTKPKRLRILKWVIIIVVIIIVNWVIMVVFIVSNLDGGLSHNIDNQPGQCPPADWLNPPY